MTSFSLAQNNTRKGKEMRARKDVDGLKCRIHCLHSREDVALAVSMDPGAAGENQGTILS